MRDDGDGARITPGICPIHKQYMLAKLLRSRPLTTKEPTPWTTTRSSR